MFRNSVILAPTLSAREHFSRGVIGTEVFLHNFSQLSHFRTPFIGTQKKFRGGKDRGFPQKFFRNPAILRPRLSTRENFCEGDDIDGGFSQIFFRNSVNLIPPLSARENFSRGMIGTEVFHIIFRNSVILAPPLSASEKCPRW